MTFLERMTVSFEDELVKIATCKLKVAGAAGYKTMGLLGAGALGFHLLSKVNRDRRLGRQLRMQQGQ